VGDIVIILAFIAAVCVLLAYNIATSEPITTVSIQGVSVTAHPNYMTGQK